MHFIGHSARTLILNLDFTQILRRTPIIQNNNKGPFHSLQLGCAGAIFNRFLIWCVCV